jgi:formate hydrogenlyase subunit 6/NADH:ubiquinone oxidoreductase subunit I
VNDPVLPEIDMLLCTGCGLCVDRCPTHAVEMTAKQRPRIARPEDCAYCGLCEEMCPAGAIALAYEIVLEPRPDGYPGQNPSGRSDLVEEA